MLPDKFFKSKPLLTAYLFLLGGGLLLPDFSGPRKISPATLRFPSPGIAHATAATTTTTNTPKTKSLFAQNLPPRFAGPDVSDWVGQRILQDYGAVFVAQGHVVRPPTVIFANAGACARWQAQVSTRRENLHGIFVELQTEAMQALLAAREEAARKKMRITPRGTWAARRNYRDTEKIWRRRVVPGLAFWQGRRKLSAREATLIRVLEPPRQVKEILQLEAKGLFFSKNFSKSILYSGTAPGASQHIAMLALDINENNNAAVRAMLARHGWFQTVISDLPHFTYLGTTQDKLPQLGLKEVVKNKRVYWTPAL